MFMVFQECLSEWPRREFAGVVITTQRTAWDTYTYVWVPKGPRDTRGGIAVVQQTDDGPLAIAWGAKCALNWAESGTRAWKRLRRFVEERGLLREDWGSGSAFEPTLQQRCRKAALRKWLESPEPALAPRSEPRRSTRSRFRAEDSP